MNIVTAGAGLRASAGIGSALNALGRHVQFDCALACAALLIGLTSASNTVNNVIAAGAKEISAATLDRKVSLLMRHFASQAGRQWFTPDLFRAVARIRGMECAAPESLAEAFYCRKAVF